MLLLSNIWSNIVKFDIFQDRQTTQITSASKTVSNIACVSIWIL